MAFVPTLVLYVLLRITYVKYISLVKSNFWFGSRIRNTVRALIQSVNQCCGSGSGIRCPFDPWIRDPESRMGRKSASGSGIRDEQPGSYFLDLRNPFFLLKYLNSLMRIRDGDSSDPESGMEKSRIRDPG
jgi:hypothetical protein